MVVGARQAGLKFLDTADLLFNLNTTDPTIKANSGKTKAYSEWQIFGWETHVEKYDEYCKRIFRLVHGETVI